MQIEDKGFKRFVINRLVPFPVILKKAGLGEYSYEGKCYCPFHINENTPSAKLYRDKRGDSLYCFSEQRKYYPTDVIERGLLGKSSVEGIYQSLVAQITPAQVEELLQEYGKPIELMPEEWGQNKDNLVKFKRQQLSYVEHIKLLYVLLK